MSQVRQLERIVLNPYGCTEDTGGSNHNHAVKIPELPRLAHQEFEALNWGKSHAWNAEVIICLDSHVVLPSKAGEPWVEEFEPHIGRMLGASSSKFAMQTPSQLDSLRKAEPALWAG